MDGLGLRQITRGRLLRVGTLLLVLCLLASALTPVEGVAAATIGFQGILFAFFGVAIPVSSFSNEEALPGRVLAVSVGILVACCVWTLAFPQEPMYADQSRYVPIASLLGVGEVTVEQSNTFSTLAWAMVPLCLVLAALNLFVCRAEKRRRRGEEDEAAGAAS